MCKVNFIDEFNVFMKYARNNQLTGRERLLWTALFTIANDRATYNAQTKEFEWPGGFFPVPNSELTLHSTLDKRSIESVRNTLKQKGLIDFHQGSRNKKAPEYKILYLSLDVGYKTVPNDAPNNVPKDVPNSVPKDAPNSDPKTADFGYKTAPIYSNKSLSVDADDALAVNKENLFCSSSGLGGAAELQKAIFDASGEAAKNYERLAPGVRQEVEAFTDQLFSLYGSRKPIAMDYIYAAGNLELAPGADGARLKTMNDLRFAFERAFQANRACQWDYIQGCLTRMKMNELYGQEE